MSVLVVGSIALDTVKTPVEEHADLLGGSASYAALAPVFSPGKTGRDCRRAIFPQSEFEFWKSRKIDVEGVQRATGKTFRWSGEYAWDLNTRETRSVALNVFEDFQARLARIVSRDRFRPLGKHRARRCNRMCSIKWNGRALSSPIQWIFGSKRRERIWTRCLPRVDLLILNDSEAREMTKETSLIKAGRKIRSFGPRYVAIKKGEHGALLFGENEFFSCGAYPLEDIHDPTGAGDTFAGGVGGLSRGARKGEVILPICARL